MFVHNFICVLRCDIARFNWKNIFGLESLGKHNSSIFGKELVAGSYKRFLFWLNLSTFRLE